MFQQSLLVNRGGTRKAGSVAASFVAQILAAGVLLIAPLLFREVLPNRLRLAANYVAPATARDLPAAKSSSDTKPSILRARPIFHAPAPDTSDQLAAALTTAPRIAVDAPELDSGPPQPGFAQPSIVRLPDIAPPPKPTAPEVEPTAPQPASAPVRVSQGVQAAKLIRKIVPPYPPLARLARIQGTVHLLGIVARDGTIRQLQLLSGHPLLAQAAFDAVRQWIYQPTLLNGVPVEVLAPIDVTFTLQ